MPRWLRWAGGGLVAMALLLGLAAWLLDTQVGHRFLVQRIAALAPANGLRFSVGRIDGSIYSRATLRDVRIGDARGLILSAPAVMLDWRPFAWLGNTLSIEALHAPVATLHKPPQLTPTGRRGPILPGFDIRVGRLAIDRLLVAPAVTGAPREGRLVGRADIRDGRAMVALDAVVAGSDAVRIRLDALPDGDRFDLAVTARGSAGGVLSRMAGFRLPVALDIAGEGRWSRWEGRGSARLGAARTADVILGVENGRYTLAGVLDPSGLVRGKLLRLAAPRIRVTGAATLADRVLDGSLTLRTASLAVDAEGALDLARSAYDGVRIGARLLRPPALFPNMTGRDVRLRVTLDGGFDTARFAYALAADRMAFDQTGLEAVRATGRGRLSAGPVSVPIRFTARRVTGVGDVAGGILANLDVRGLLRVTARTITGDGLRLTSDKLTSRISVLIDLVTGQYSVGIDGQLGRYLIPGLGIVDVRSALRVVPGPGGRGTRVVGRAEAWVRRFDNAFLRGLAGGLPHIVTGLERGTDGILYLRDTRIMAPALSATGNGYRRRDGSFHFEGSGRQRDYGSFQLLLDGPIERPRLDIRLARPLDALGLRDVRLLLDPTPAGFAYRAAGGSTLGPFTSSGAILLPRGGSATIAIADLRASGFTASGALRVVPGGFDGRLVIAGGGVSGTLGFAPRGQAQAIAVDLALDRARLGEPGGLFVGRGSVDGTIVLDPAGVTVDGTLRAQRLVSGSLRLAELVATGRLVGGVGEVRASLRGSRRQAFELQAAAQVARDRIVLRASGDLDERPIALAAPAVVVREGDGWRLAPATLTFAGGRAVVAGRFGGDAVALDTQLQGLPLSLLDIASDGLGLGGTASGRIHYAQASDAAPTGSADIRVRNLTRSGLLVTSAPIDLGVAAVLRADSAGIRAIAASGGRTIGRAQARLAPLGGGGIASRLGNARMFAQLRYAGPADTLWRLTGVETFDLSGDVSVGADATGTLADPAIRGSLATRTLRVASPVIGASIRDVAATGRFAGSRLSIERFAGRAGEGTVSGRGVFDLAAARGFGMDLALQAERAELIALDNIGATVTGPLTIRSDGAGGVIAGTVVLDRSRYVLGRATAETVLPRVRVREVNRRGEEVEVDAPPVPWRLALEARARNRLRVEGLGLESEWSADLAIAGTVGAPQIRGRADLIRGEYEFAGRTFDLDRGAIRFDGSVPADPALDIAANANTQGLNATIRVTGSGQRPEISFTSVPALPEDELLSRLLFGTSITNLSAPEALQLAAAVAALQGGGTGLNPINAVRDAAGLDRLRILPADPQRGQGTAIAAGKYVTRNTFVEIVTDGAGYSATQVEFQVTRWLSLLGSISTLGRESVNVRVSRDY